MNSVKYKYVALDLRKETKMCDSSKMETPVNMASILAPSVAQYLHPDYLQPLPTTVSYTSILFSFYHKPFRYFWIKNI